MNCIVSDTLAGTTGPVEAVPSPSLICMHSGSGLKTAQGLPLLPKSSESVAGSATTLSQMQKPALFVPSEWGAAKSAE